MNDILSAIPAILSLVLIEGLLSVDNALAIAAMASGLPENQKRKALRYGIVGAYVLRGVSLAFAAWIANNTWVKVLGALYLVYLAASELCGKDEEEQLREAKPKSFWLTVASIELLDLSLSLDNVVAAVALDRRMWVVWTGVFIGIACLRFVAGACIRLIEKHPILKTTAFLLVGFIGVILCVEVLLEHQGARLPSVVKFGGIFLIVAASLIYERFSKAVATPTSSALSRINAGILKKL